MECECRLANLTAGTSGVRDAHPAGLTSSQPGAWSWAEVPRNKVTCRLVYSYDLGVFCMPKFTAYEMSKKKSKQI